MNTNALANKRNHWLQLWQELQTVRYQSLPTEQEVDQVMAYLPTRLSDEPVSDWLRRAKQPKRGVIIPFPQFSLQPITEIQLYAADDGKERYPLIEQPVETPDEKFRLAVTKTIKGLQIDITTLGLAIEDYADCYIGLAGSDDPDSLVAVIQLDLYGQGSTIIDDCDDNRKVLCVNPKFFLIEPDDA